MTTLTSAQASKTLALGLLTGLGLSFSAQAQEVGNVAHCSLREKSDGLWGDL